MFSLIGGAGYPLGSEVTSSTTTADLEKRKEMFGFIFLLRSRQLPKFAELQFMRNSATVGEINGEITFSTSTFWVFMTNF